MFPSDSINHQNLKLAEFVAGLQNQARLPAPPPPYTAAAQLNDQPLGEFEDDEDDGMPLPPVVLSIDTSITIDGQANTVAIPTALGVGSEEDQAESPATTSNSFTQSLQQQRQAKSAQIASSIVSALKSCGVLDDGEGGRTRPIKININAGLHIKGARNVVCSGLKRRMEPVPSTIPSDALGRGRKRRAQSV